MVDAAGAWKMVQETAWEMGFHRVAWKVAGKEWEARVREEVSGAERTAELPPFSDRGKWGSGETEPAV